MTPLELTLCGAVATLFTALFYLVRLLQSRHDAEIARMAADAAVQMAVGKEVRAAQVEQALAAAAQREVIRELSKAVERNSDSLDRYRSQSRFPAVREGQR